MTIISDTEMTTVPLSDTLLHAVLSEMVADEGLRNGYGSDFYCRDDAPDLLDVWSVRSALRDIGVDRAEAHLVIECGREEVFLIRKSWHTVWTVGGQEWCESCADSYSFRCEHCGVREHADDMNTVVTSSYGSTSAWCESCYQSDCTYCDQCEECFSDALDHDHGCCQSAAPTRFSLRNDGEDRVAADVRVSVALAGGEISDEGLSECRWLLSRHGYSPLVGKLAESVGAMWQQRDGNYPKRVARAAYKLNGTKLSAEVVSDLGNVARAHSSTGTTYRLSFTRELNGTAAEFGHPDSCYWKRGYGISRCALKEQGAIGMRSWHNDGDRTPSGRAWLQPLRWVEATTEDPETCSCGCGNQFEPRTIPAHWENTFDTDNPDGWLVFNGYHEMSGYVPARIMAHMAGMSYKKVGLYYGPAYINAGGYLIAPADKCEATEDISMSFDVECDRHQD